MLRIILDTNFLMAVSQFKIDIFSEIERVIDKPYKLYTLDKVVEELKNIEGKNKRDAKFALLLVKKIKILKTNEKYADDSLEKLSRKKEVIVGTQDINLIKRLKNRKLRIRQKKYIILQ